jgi:hypothetical protein
MQSSHTFTVDSAVFDERNLVSAAGLVPVLELAEQTGLSELIAEHVQLPSTRVRSGAVNPAGKLTSIIAAMMCGADCIDDVNVLRAGGTPRVFDEVYAPSTLGIFLREFTFGHANQLAAVQRAHLVALAQRVPLLPGIEQRAFLDIDSPGLDIAVVPAPRHLAGGQRPPGQCPSSAPACRPVGRWDAVVLGRATIPAARPQPHRPGAIALLPR